MNFLVELMLFVTLFCWWGDRLSQRGRDNSDMQPKGKRSGLIIRTDYLTGVQYVEGSFGGLSVRVDADGKPIVVSAEEPEA